jgi:hypothetical protein
MNERIEIGLPTRLEDWKLMGRTVRLVISIPTYAALSLVYGVVGLSAFVLSRNLTLFGRVVLFGDLPLADRLAVLLELYPVFGTAYTRVQTVVLVLTAALIGVELAVATYHFREHDLSVGQGSGSLAGVVLGTLGAGCAACGSAVLAGVLSLFGASGVLLALPLDGLEFAVLAVVVLILSLYWLADGMRGGTVAGCPVDVGEGKR